MTPHDLGLQLRALVIRDRQAGRPLDPQRLQAVVSDLAGAEHADLVAPLRYLILSAPFASAAAQEPPLAGGALLPRLRHELTQMYAEPVCLRLQPVLEGLLGLSAAAGSGAAASPPPPPAAAAASAPPGAAPSYAAAPPSAPARNGGAGINSVLVLLCGALLLALGGLTGLWRLQRPQAGVAASPPSAPAGGQSLPSQLPPVAQAPAATPPAAAPAAPAVPAIPEPPAASAAGAGATGAGSDEALSRAQGSVERLVVALSDKDFAQVERLIGMGAADQFEPGFYNQFDGVSLQDLRPAGQRGSIVTLEGVMVFRWPDGSQQSETRRFSVDSDQDPPLIVSSTFGRVLKER